jgi:hypothetical protein
LLELPCLKCLEKDPRRRDGRAEECAQDLHATERSASAFDDGRGIGRLHPAIGRPCAANKADAEDAGPMRSVYLRVGGDLDGTVIYLDLGDPSRRAV